MNSTANVYLPTPECHQLRQLLLDELALGRLLQHQLEQEGQLLARMEPEQLQRAGQSKSAILQRLNDQTKQRMDWMSQQQLPLAADFLQHPQIRQQPEIARLWQQLAAQYRHNRDRSIQLNELVLTAKRRIQQRIHILRGQPDRSPLLYTETGQGKSARRGQGYIQA